MWSVLYCCQDLKDKEGRDGDMPYLVQFLQLKKYELELYICDEVIQ